MDLVALESFNLVARHGGIGRASRASQRPKATLSRHVAELEVALGVRLVERGARRTRLTEEGQALHDRTAPLLVDVEDAAKAIASGDERPRGLLRISAPALFANVALGKLAADFVARHPDVQVDVAAEDRTVDLVEEGYDLVIRVNPPKDEMLVGRKFLRDRLVVVASPAVSAPTGDQAVAGILHQSSTGTPWRIGSGDAVRTIAPKPVLRLATFLMVRDALLRGAGVGLLPLSLALRDIESGALVEWGIVEDREAELWALYTSRRLLSRKVSAFLDHLRDAFPNGEPNELAALLTE